MAIRSTGIRPIERNGLRGFGLTITIENTEQREVMDPVAVEAATEKQAAGTSRPTISNSSEPPRSNTAGEAPSSSQASPAAPSDEPFEPVAFLRKSAADFRPHCQRPDACGASGLKHCYVCQKAVEADAVPA